jgi:hypothetical protein
MSDFVLIITGMSTQNVELQFKKAHSKQTVMLAKHEKPLPLNVENALFETEAYSSITCY